ncbi:MAG: murein L,D-transpeptidase [Bacteroidia bacterium]
MLRYGRYSFLLTLFLVLTIISCNKCSDDKKTEIVLVEKPEMVNEEVGKQLMKTLAAIDITKYMVVQDDTLYSTRWILDFYNKRKYSVVFTDKGKLTSQGDTLLDMIHNADVYGLFKEDYHSEKIDSLLAASHDSVTKKFDAIKLMNADLLMTDAFFTMAVHVNKGRLNADSLTFEWKGGQMDTSVVDILNKVLPKNSLRAAIDSLEPKNSYYQSLKRALRDAKFEFRETDWDSLASRNQDSTTFMARVKKRLDGSYDYTDSVKGSDSIRLVKAIKNFQCRHNLIEDGKIGKLTFKAMQRTKQDYFDQIAMNMERWRWSRIPTEKRYVWVNIPKFEMKVMEDDTLVMKSRVIIGEPDHQTPLLKSTIRYFIIYPYWNVPFSIATKEILPILKWDTTYLRRKHFEVLNGNNQVVDPQTIKWKRYSKTYFPWRLRQAIGDDNSLGILKFNFDNKYGVYMHDTDARRLFAREMRALSHGCCRLEKFMDFATFLIREDSVKYPVDSLKSDITKEQQKYVYIKKPIAIYINYFTVEADEWGEIHYFIDVYQRDEKMLRELKQHKKKK